jgi:cobalamin biosynthesis protein CobD/CbiB
MFNRTLDTVLVLIVVVCVGARLWAWWFGEPPHWWPVCWIPSFISGYPSDLCR